MNQSGRAGEKGGGGEGRERGGGKEEGERRGEDVVLR